MDLQRYRKYKPLTNDKMNNKNFFDTNITSNIDKLLDEMVYDNTKVISIEKYVDEYDDIKLNYDITRDNNLNTNVIMPKSKYLNTLFDTYNTSKKIINQFNVDLPREQVIVNNTVITTINQLYSQFRYNNQTVIIELLPSYSHVSIMMALIKPPPKKAISLLLLILALSCQSAFFASFNHLLQKQLKLNEILDMHSEFKNSRKKKYIVSDAKQKKVISFDITTSSFKCSLTAFYSIINIDNALVKHIIKSTTLFDLNSNNTIIKYEVVPKISNDNESCI